MKNHCIMTSCLVQYRTTFHPQNCPHPALYVIDKAVTDSLRYLVPSAHQQILQFLHTARRECDNRNWDFQMETQMSYWIHLR